MNVFLTAMTIILVICDFFVLSHQKRRIEELTKTIDRLAKENDRLKNLLIKK